MDDINATIKELKDEIRKLESYNDPISRDERIALYSRLTVIHNRILGLESERRMLLQSNFTNNSTDTPAIDTPPTDTPHTSTPPTDTSTDTSTRPLPCNRTWRQCIVRWANNTSTYDEDPLCEAKRVWGHLFLNIYDLFSKIYVYYMSPKTKTE